MKKLMSTLFVIAAAAGLALAADKPDFSGTWKMDPDKSVFGPIPPPTSMTRVIDHKDPAVKVDQTQVGLQGEIKVSYKYSTDGTETTNSFIGNELKSKATWDGKNLLIASTANMGGAEVKLKDKWTLSDDGKTLTDVLSISSPQGDFDLTYVLVKQ